MNKEDSNRDPKVNFVIERIRLILARAESPDEGEATIAMEMAHKMLKKYNLSLSDMEFEKETIVEKVYEQEDKPVPTWKQAFLLHITKANYCQAYYNTDTDVFIMVGRTVNISTAQSMSKYLINTVQRMARKYPGDLEEKRDYRLGLVKTLGYRLEQLIAKEKVETPTSTALVLREAGAVDKYLAKVHPQLHLQTSERQVRFVPAGEIDEYKAFDQGAIDGQGVPLHRQVDAKKKAGIRSKEIK